jgi:hypothetical protein
MSYSKTCDEAYVHVADGRVDLNVHIEIGDYVGHYQWTSKNLNECLSNSGGRFKWGDQNFSWTARNIRLEGTHILHADLADGTGHNYVPASVNLDEHLVNRNGLLGWQD